MPRFAANLSLMFCEYPFLERFGAAARAGFKAVEFQFPYDFNPEEIRTRLAEHGLMLTLFNMPPGNAAAGERGLACLPERMDDFRASVDVALRYADVFDCPKLHCMAGVVQPGAQDARHLDTYCANLDYAARLAAGRMVLIEPINARDIPGYYLRTTAQARSVIDTVAVPNLKLQLDLYHCQISEGDLSTHIRDYADVTGHIQIAGVPGRHEPDVGEINYPALFPLVDASGYDGFIGVEYIPEGRTKDGLGWFAPFRNS